jgi:hypothetical protein
MWEVIHNSPQSAMHSLYNIPVYLLRKNFMDLKKTLDNYLGKSVKFSEEDLGDGTKQVCDLETGDCYVVRERDGLIERAGHMQTANRKVRVETSRGIKQLLNG